ncbi:MAG: hypothetical protein ACSHXW_17975, partial [Yoonia sp.]
MAFSVEKLRATNRGLLAPPKRFILLFSYNYFATGIFGQSYIQKPKTQREICNEVKHKRYRRRLISTPSLWGVNLVCPLARWLPQSFSLNLASNFFVSKTFGQCHI